MRSQINPPPRLDTGWRIVSHRSFPLLRRDAPVGSLTAVARGLILFFPLTHYGLFAPFQDEKCMKFPSEDFPPRLQKTQKKTNEKRMCLLFCFCFFCFFPDFKLNPPSSPPPSSPQLLPCSIFYESADDVRLHDKSSSRGLLYPILQISSLTSQSC